MDIGSLGQKQYRKRHIYVSAVGVKAIPSRKDESNDGTGGTEIFEFPHHVRQNRLQRTGAKHDQEFFLDVGNETKNRKAGQPGDDSEHDNNKEEAGEVEGSD